MHLKQGEKISNLENASQNLTFDYLQKDFEKNLQKYLQKQNMWCKRGPKMLNIKKSIHAHLMRIYWFNF
jgi:hypothetical protein